MLPGGTQLYLTLILPKLAMQAIKRPPAANPAAFSRWGGLIC